jgi:glutaredoxin
VKEFLHEKAVAFIEKAIAADEAVLDALMAMGFSVTPVVVIDNETVVGFN